MPTIDKPTVQDLAAVNAAYWAQISKIRLQAGIFTFTNHEYQYEPMRSEVRRVCYMKGTRGGFSEIAILRSLHGMIHGYYPEGVLYMFPTTDDVREFGQSRFTPLIHANRLSIGRYVKTGGKGTDTASLKKIHNAFLYLRGARITQKVGDAGESGESSKMRGIGVDRIVFDEVDLMPKEIVAKARGRYGKSARKEEVYISNPTIPDFGIDAQFQKSDQRHWFRKCDCGTWTCAELSFPECVKLRPDGTGYIACSNCGKEVFVRNGEWVPSARENTDYMHGYRWSQLSGTTNDPAEILADFNDPPEGNLGDVYRLRLGLPYVAAEDKLNASVVYACCNNNVMASSSYGPCAMGVDVGKIKHILIGQRIGKEDFELLKAIRLSRWNDIHDLAERFNVKSAAIDIRPYEDEVRRFQEAERYRIYLCEYSENPMQEAVWNNKTKTVKAYRTGLFDRTHSLITEEHLVIPRRCEEIEMFVKQVCNTAKISELNQRTGSAVYRYRVVGTGGDHYRNALNYLYLAASGGKIGRATRDGMARKLPAVADNEYARL